MALINCTECGKEASTQAEACPHCGMKMPTKQKQGTDHGTDHGFCVKKS